MGRGDGGERQVAMLAKQVSRQKINILQTRLNCQIFLSAILSTATGVTKYYNHVLMGHVFTF